MNQVKRPAINLALSASPRRRRKRRTLILAIAAGLLVLLSFAALFSFQPARRAVAAAKDGQRQFLEAQASLETQNFSEASASLDSAIASFTDAKKDLRVLTWLRVVPIAERQYRAATHLLNVGITTGNSVREVTEFGRTTIEPFRTNGKLSLDSLSPSDKREILKKLTDAQPVLASANDQIDSALEELEKIPSSGLLKPLKDAVGPMRDKLPVVKNVIDEVASLSRTIPVLAGYPDEQTYLFLLENNTELRPAGGFIGTYGVLRVQNGEISSFTTDNIYNLDVPAEAYLRVTPPEPLQRYVQASNWYLRDSNWSPNFPDSAKKALWFYEQERGPVKSFDGVIAVTPTFIESLIELTGDVSVQGITFTKENFIDTLEYQVEKGYYRQGLAESDRKEIIGSLSQILLDRILALPQARWGALWTTFIQDVERKQILIYLNAPEVQSIIESENWGGVVKATQGDYLQVVDANMAALKSDPGVKRSIDYSVRLENGSAIATLTVVYRNEGTLSWKSTRYRTYTRLYVPAGSELISSSGFSTNDKLLNGKPTDAGVFSELGKTVFAGFISIEPQETGTLTLDYRLPDELARQIRSRQYVLDVQKQPGSGEHELTVKFDGQFQPKSILPSDFSSSVNGSVVQYSGQLDKDLRFSVTD